MLYWTVRKDRTTILHVLGAVSRSIKHLAALQRKKARKQGNPLIALALIEHMGDIIAAEPIARLARVHFSDARIVWFVRKPYQALPSAYPEVTEIVVVQCMTEWLLLWSYGIIDVVWDLHISERPCPVCKAFFQKPGEPGKVTYQTYYSLGNLLETQCMSAGIEKLRDGPVLHSSPDIIRSVDALALPARFVVIHTKSNDDARDWMDTKWIEFINHLRTSFSGHVIEVGAIPHIVGSDAVQQRSLSGKLSMLETAEVIRRAELFVGIDSGPAHLANAVGTPGVILLGHYKNFHSYMPYSGLYATKLGATILRANGPAANLAVNEVTQAVDFKLLHCR